MNKTDNSKVSAEIQNVDVPREIPSPGTVPEYEVFKIHPSKLGQYKNYALSGICIVVAIAGAFISLWMLLLLLLSAFFYILAWYHVAATEYRLTNERFFMTSGLIAVRRDEVELFRIKDVYVKQNFWERIFKIGNVTVLSSDDTTPHIEMRGIAAPNEYKELLRNHYRASRKAERLRTAEFIES